VAAACAAAAPSLRGAFLWDDDANVTENPLLRTAEGLVHIWKTPGATQQYYPLTHTSFWVDYQIHGLSPLGYRVENLALHLLTALLLALAARRLVPGPGWLAGALFAVHPLNVESVAWITERKNVLAAPLLLGSFLALHGAFSAFEAGKGRRGAGLAAGCWVLFSLAMLAKSAVAPGALLMPLLLLPVFWRWRGRLALAGAALTAVALPVGLVTARIEGLHRMQHPGDFGAPLLARLEQAGQAVAFYASRAVFPADLAFFYPTPLLSSPWPPGLLLAALVAGGVAALGWLAWRGRPWPLLLTLAILGLLFPALGLVEIYFFRYAPAQNHFAYLALLPGCVALAVGLSWSLGLAHRPRVKEAALAVLLGALSLVSRKEAAKFTSTEALFRASLEVYPEPWPAHQALGLAALAAGRSGEALVHFRAALRVRPRDPEILSNLGASLSLVGSHEEAIAALRRATELDPTPVEPWINLAEGLRAAGRPGPAAEAYREALARAPENARVLRRLAELLLTTREPGLRDPEEAARLASAACARTRRTRGRCLRLLEAAQRAAGREEEADLTRGQAEQAEAQERRGE
jgi:tetratricopeptide (TPR) repeat protein